MIAIKKLTKNEIVMYLEEVNKRLADKNIHGEIILCGGAALALAYDARDATYDIDAIYRPKGEIKEIIDAISGENNLNSQWLNDDVSMFFTENVTSFEYRSLSNLTIKVVDAKSLLAMKLISARSNTSDLSDAVTLMKTLSIKGTEELYSIIETHGFPLHPNILVECKAFARTAYKEYIKNSEVPSGEKTSMLDTLQINRKLAETRNTEPKEKKSGEPEL